MKPEILERDEHPIEIDGRQFTLREMSAKETRKYWENLTTLQVEGEGDDIADTLRRQEEQFTDFFINLLGRDAQGEPVTKEWLEEHLTIKRMTQILEIQNRLNGLDELIKKVLLRQVQKMEESAE